MTSATPARPPFDTRLTLRVLGEASLACSAPGPEPPATLGPGKPLALLVYLALAPERSASREHLLDLLWSDVDPDKGRAALRQTLYEIKRRLGDGVLTTAKESIRLAATIESDRGIFLDAVSSGELERAVGFYAGDFLPSFALPGGAEFERWADAERFQLRSTFIRAAESLVRCWLATTRLREAQDLARRVRDADPINESGWRLVLETLLAGGDSLRANVEADRLEQMLAEEGREADPSTRSTLRLVRQGPNGGSVDSPAAQELFTELVGREREFAAMLHQWEAARRGGARHVHMSAPAGIGKSRLLADLHTRLRVLRARVVMVRAHPGERRIPYSLAADLAEALATLPGAAGISPSAAATLVDLCPSLSSRLSAQPQTPDASAAMRHRLVAIEELVAVVAEERPLAILIDDLHWSDPESRQVLEGVVGRLPTAPVVVITASRPVPQGVLHTPATVRLELPPLTVSQVAELIASVASVPDATWSRNLPGALHAATGGSPLLARETLHLALDRRLLSIASDGWLCPDPPQLWSVLASGSALSRRIDSLSPAARLNLLLLSIAGTPVPSSTLAAGTGDSRHSATGGLAELEQRGLAHRDGESWQPAHDEIGELCVRLADAAALRAAHATLGRALTQHTSDVQGLRMAVSHLAAADDEVLPRVFAKAVALLRDTGDRRPPSELATELLGDGASSDRARQLVAALPIRLRFNFDTLTRVAGVAAVTLTIVVGGIAWSKWPASPPPDAVVLGIPYDQRRPVTAASVRLDGWRNGETVLELQRSRADRHVPRGNFGVSYLPVAGPGGVWAHLDVQPREAGGHEIALTLANGRQRRLTYSPRDDEFPAFSPDGRYLVYQAARNSDYYHYDLIVHDLAADTTWWLTGPADSSDYFDPSDRAPAWSPDGTRIAFVRQHWDDRPNAICWRSVDRRLGECFVPTGVVPASIRGWYDSDNVLITADEGRTLARVTLDNEKVHILASEPEGNWTAVSTSGRFALLMKSQEASPNVYTYVVSVDAPESRKRLTISGSDAGFAGVFGHDADTTRYLDSLAIGARAAAIPVDQPFTASVTGFDRQGRRMAVPVVRWSSNDTSVARVEYLTGVIRPHREGHVTIVASAGGWRTDSAIFKIGAPLYDVIMEERWNARGPTVRFAGDSSGNDRWRAFGHRMPRLIRAANGTEALDVNGDGNYASGVYSLERISAQHGMGIEALVSTMVDRYQWQVLTLSLTSQLDESHLQDWDHRIGGFRLVDEDAGSCGASYPGTERREGLRRMVVNGGMNWTSLAVDEGLANGAWYRIRVQIFSDGTCGIALDGTPLWRHDGRLSLERPFRISISGNAAFTPMLVGPLSVWRGVKPDIDWTTLDDPATTTSLPR